ncbi:MAG: CocE/NonD family hydrolase [Acidobacteriota bacterium]
MSPFVRPPSRARHFVSLIRSRLPRPSVLGGLAVLVAVLVPLLSAPAARAQPGDAPSWMKEFERRAKAVRSDYTKYEAQIPMRDGVRLFTAIYVPNDPDGGPYPILMQRTPYSVGPYGVDRYKERLGPTKAFEKAGYIFVFQDVRGRYMSEGEYVNMRPHRSSKSGPQDIDESTDTYDTIEWLLANVEGHNGKVGQWGISYPGFYTSAGMIDSHPALAAVSPQAPIADWFWDDMHRHGAFVLPLAFRFFSSFGVPREEPTTEREEGYDFETADGFDFYFDLGPLSNVNEKHFNGEIPFWNEVVAHPNYDEFWQSRNILPHLQNISAAVLVVGGWYDMEDLYGPLETYAAVEANNPDTWSGLVMGPWRHGGWARGPGRNLGEVDFGFSTADFYSEHVIFPFFEHFLRGAKGAPPLPEALVFDTGADRWEHFEAWPPERAEARRIYLHADGAVAFDRAPTDEAPAEGSPADAPAEAPFADSSFSDSFFSDPDKPVPYTQAVTTRWHAEHMVEDQRFAARRPDVLVYETEVLEDDLTLAGSIFADLWVSTTGTAADWIVKVVDVYPPENPDPVEGDMPWEDDEKAFLGNFHQLVRGEAMRGRFRESYVEPKPFEPGVPTKVRFELQDVFHTFKRGHRLQVQIQSTWFPLIDRNPQTWVPNIFKAKESDFVTQRHTIHRSAEHPSALDVLVLPGLGAR